MKAVLVRLWPLDPVTGERVEVRVSAHGDNLIGRAVQAKGGDSWIPALVQAPVLRLSLFDGAFASAVSVAQATLKLNLGPLMRRALPNINRYAWAGAKVEIYSAAPGDAWPWKVAFAGSVATYGGIARELNLSVKIDTEPFEADLLNRTYAGTGGAEGGLDLKGRVKPLAIGWTMNVEPVQVNAVNNVYQFSGYGPIEAVTTLFERASEFPASSGDYANYAALVAATIANGQWATCLAEGLIRLGAPAYGVITGDIKGHVVGSATPRLTGAVIKSLAEIAGVSTALIDTDSFDLIDLAVPYPINLFLADQTSLLDIVQGLVLPCNAQAGVGIDGLLFATRIDFAASPAMTLDTRGRAKPGVIESREDFVSPPFWRTVFGANRSWRVHTTEEVAFGSNLIPRGLYDAAETYREGQYVDSADGSQWLYGYATPTAGNAPPTWPTASNTWWSNLRPPITAEGIAVPRHDPGGASATFTANYTGALYSGQLPFNTQIRRYHGTTDRSGDATWTIVTQGSISGGTVTITDGVVTIPTGCVIPISTDIELKSDIGGLEIVSHISVVRLDSVPPSTGGGGGTTVTDNTLNSVSSTTMVALSDIMTVKTGASGVITFAGILSIIAPAEYPDDSFGAQMRWKYRPVGGSFSDVGSVINELTAALVSYDVDWNWYYTSYGSIDVAASQTGLTAATDYEVQLWGARDTSTPTKTLSFGGTCSATGS